jgi:NitT/TauT family transport system substrate-binding protein
LVNPFAMTQCSIFIYDCGPNMSHFLTRRRLIHVAGGLTAVTCLGQRPAAAVEKSDISIAASSLGMTSLPLVVALQRGYFKDEGVRVQATAFAGGSKALQSMLGGTSDVVAGAYWQTFTMAAKGQRLQAFVNQVRYPALAVGVSKQIAATYQSPRDLKGTKVGVSAPGSSTHMIVNHLITRDGLKPDDVAIIGVGSSATAVAAMQSGRIDAICLNDPGMTILVRAGHCIVVADLRTRAGTEQALGGPFPETSLYAKAEFVQDNPQTVQALTNAVVRAERWLNLATPEEVAGSVPPELMMESRELYGAAFTNTREALSPDGRITPQAARIVHDVIVSFSADVKAAKIDVDATYTNRFVDKALEKYG